MWPTCVSVTMAVNGSCANVREFRFRPSGDRGRGVETRGAGECRARVDDNDVVIRQPSPLLQELRDVGCADDHDARRRREHVQERFARLSSAMQLRAARKASATSRVHRRRRRKPAGRRRCSRVATTRAPVAADGGVAHPSIALAAVVIDGTTCDANCAAAWQDRTAKRVRRQCRRSMFEACRRHDVEAAAMTSASTQPPETEPWKSSSLAITMRPPSGTGRGPSVSTTMASATGRPASSHARHGAVNAQNASRFWRFRSCVHGRRPVTGSS